MKFPAALDQGLASELVALANPQDDFETIKGKTYCTDSFYDGKLNVQNFPLFIVGNVFFIMHGFF